jgi:hypothetical protein
MRGRHHDDWGCDGAAFDGRALEEDERPGLLIDRQRIAIARSASGIEREDSRFLRSEGEFKPGHFDLLAGGSETDPGLAGVRPTLSVLVKLTYSRPPGLSTPPPAADWL